MKHIIPAFILSMRGNILKDKHRVEKLWLFNSENFSWLSELYQSLEGDFHINIYIIM